MHVRYANAIRIPVILYLAACTGSPDETGHSFRIYEEDGVTIAETTGGPKYEGEIFSYEPVVTLRQDPQDEESLIYYARYMTMDSEGNYYVVDGSAYRIVVFDQAGEYVRSFGRRGSGPGEYQWMTVVDFDGEIFQIWDSNNRRLNRVHRDGTFLGSQPPPGNMRVARMRALRDNRLIVWFSRNEGREGFAYTSGVNYVMSSAGDTLATVVTDEIITGYHRLISGPGGRSGYQQGSIPFVSYPCMEYIPERGFMVTTGMTPEVLWYDLSGEHKQTFRLDMAPRRVTPEIRQAYEESWLRGERERAEQSGREPRSMPEQVYPEIAAIWYGGFVDDAGYVWLQILQLPGGEESGEWSRFFILDPEGCYLGYARLPNRQTTIVNGHMLAAITDPETGEVDLTVFTITPIPRGLRYP